MNHPVLLLNPHELAAIQGGDAIDDYLQQQYISQHASAYVQYYYVPSQPNYPPYFF